MSLGPAGVQAVHRVVAQVQALTAWSAWLRERDEVLRRDLGRVTPELAPPLADELASNARERAAVLARIEIDDRVPRVAPPTPAAVLAVRQGWTGEALARHLQDAGLSVPWVVRDGPSAIAAMITAQPSLVLVEDSLDLLEVERVADRARRFAAATSVCVLTDRDDVAPAAFPGAGVTVLSRRADPAEVAARAVARLSG